MSDEKELIRKRAKNFQTKTDELKQIRASRDRDKKNETIANKDLRR